MKFEHLWDEERVTRLKEFVDSEPLLVDVRERFILYEKQAEEVESIPNEEVIGTIRINLSKFADFCFGVIPCDENTITSIARKFSASSPCLESYGELYWQSCNKFWHGLFGRY